VSIGAFEHFGFDRYDEFFTLAHEILPYDGILLLHTITALTLPQMADPLHALPRRMRQRLPGRLHRCQPVHAGEVASDKERIIRCRKA
jgi:cyclopropane fatty-acyl-phospholipid synthase-like methyltransferase